MSTSLSSDKSRVRHHTEAEERLCALYNRVRLRFSLLEMLLVVLFLTAISLGGASQALDRSLDLWLPPGFAHVAIYLFLILIGLRLFLFPLHWASDYRLERRFKLLHQSPGGWVKDWLQVSLLFACLATAILTPMVQTLRWWPWLLLPWVAVYLGLRAFYYRWLFLPVISLFYPVRFLRAKSFYLPGIGRRLMPVYEVKVSGKTRRMNACVLMNGQSGTILVTDTLINDFNDAEERVAIAHEFGHLYDRLVLEEQTPHGLAQARRKVLLMGGGMLAATALSLAAMEFLAPGLGFGGVADLAAVPLEAALILCGVHFLAPLTNVEARTDEREADEYALRITRDPDSYLSVMRKLRRVNLQESAPCFLDHFLFGDHPTYLERMRMAHDFRRRQEDGSGGRGGRRS